MRPITIGRQHDTCDPPPWASLAADMKVSDTAKAAIRQLGGLHAEDALDCQGRHVLGYSHRLRSPRPEGMVETLVEAWFIQDVENTAGHIRSFCQGQLKQSQFDALALWWIVLRPNRMEFTLAMRHCELGEYANALVTLIRTRAIGALSVDAKGRLLEQVVIWWTARERSALDI